MEKRIEDYEDKLNQTQDETEELRTKAERLDLLNHELR
jgi:hypothetical protein